MGDIGCVHVFATSGGHKPKPEFHTSCINCGSTLFVRDGVVVKTTESAISKQLAAARRERDEALQALRTADEWLDKYLRGESGLDFIEPYRAARKASTVIRSVLARLSPEDTVA